MITVAKPTVVEPEKKEVPPINPFPALPIIQRKQEDDGLLQNNEMATTITEKHIRQQHLVPYSEVRQDRIISIADHSSTWASRLFQTSPDSVISPDSVMTGGELRIASDGYTYTKQEFFDYYGSFAQWERAPRIVPQMPLPITKIEESEKIESEISESDHDDELFSDYGEEEEIDDIALARMMTIRLRHVTLS